MDGFGDQGTGFQICASFLVGDEQIALVYYESLPPLDSVAPNHCGSILRRAQSY